MDGKRQQGGVKKTSPRDETSQKHSEFFGTARTNKDHQANRTMSEPEPEPERNPARKRHDETIQAANSKCYLDLPMEPICTQRGRYRELGKPRGQPRMEKTIGKRYAPPCEHEGCKEFAQKEKKLWKNNTAPLRNA